jgi:hypothetical protein
MAHKLETIPRNISQVVGLFVPITNALGIVAFENGRLKGTFEMVDANEFTLTLCPGKWWCQLRVH